MARAVKPAAQCRQLVLFILVSFPGDDAAAPDAYSDRWLDADAQVRSNPDANFPEGRAVAAAYC
jgi:hypothetical protein